MDQLISESNIYAETLFSLGNFHVTNSLLTTWIVVGFIFIVALFVRRSNYSLIPRGIQNLMEVIVEKMYELVDNATQSRQKTRKIFPIVFTLFVFILLNNLFGLLPIFGTIGQLKQSGEGTFLLTPFFRAGTADLNTTLAMALFSVIASNLFGLFAVGIWATFNRFFNVQEGIWLPFKNLFITSRGLNIGKRLGGFFLDIFVGIIKIFVGLLDIVGEMSKLISLSFRLYGNMFAGQVLLGSMTLLVPYIIPLPFYFTSLISAFVQAIVFSMLTMVYFVMVMQEE